MLGYRVRVASHAERKSQKIWLACGFHCQRAHGKALYILQKAVALHLPEQAYIDSILGMLIVEVTLNSDIHQDSLALLLQLPGLQAAWVIQSKAAAGHLTLAGERESCSFAGMLLTVTGQ